jgi:Dolichyl-phosphate-mannose-protein mannosyltransferase
VRAPARRRHPGAAASSGRRLRIDAALGLARAHRLFVALLAVGVVLRLLVTVAYRPALFYTGDSYTYLHAAQTLAPDPQRPLLYSVFLRPLLETGFLTLVPLVQHGLGLAVGVVVYALVRRAGGPAWLGCLAAAPVLLDGLQVAVEHYLLAEALFEAFVVAAFALVVWWGRPSPAAAAGAGVLLAAATLTRTVGVVLVLPVLAYLLVRRVRPAAVAALLAAFALPLLGYAVWFESRWDRFHLTAYDGYFLYGRVGAVVDCRGLDVPPRERVLCAAERLPDHRPTWYVFAPESPIQRLSANVAHDVTEVNASAGDFAQQIVGHRPREYVRAAVVDFLGYFRAGRTSTVLQNPVAETELPPDRVAYYEPERALLAVKDVGRPSDVPVVHRRLAGRLADLQGWTWVPGSLLALAALLALASPLFAPRGSGPSHVSTGVFFAASALLLLALPAAVVSFDWRYVVPTLPLFGLAGAYGLLTLLRALSERR